MKNKKVDTKEICEKILEYINLRIREELSIDKAYAIDVIVDVEQNPATKVIVLTLDLHVVTTPFIYEKTKSKINAIADEAIEYADALLKKLGYKEYKIVKK